MFTFLVKDQKKVNEAYKILLDNNLEVEYYDTETRFVIIKTIIDFNSKETRVERFATYSNKEGAASSIENNIKEDHPEVKLDFNIYEKLIKMENIDFTIDLNEDIRINYLVFLL